MNPANGSLATYRVGGREYPLVTRQNCKVCANPNRMEIERALVTGYTYKAILRRLPPDHGLNERNLGDHLNGGHVPLDNEAVKKAQDEAADERGEIAIQAAGALSPYAAFAHRIIKRAAERLDREELEPSIQDALQASKLLAQLEPRSNSYGDREIFEGFMIYLKTAQEMMDPDMFQAFARSLKRNPVLRQLLGRGGVSG